MLPARFALLLSLSLLLGTLRFAVLLVTFEQPGACLCWPPFWFRSPSGCRFHVCRYDLLTLPSLEATHGSMRRPGRISLPASTQTGPIRPPASKAWAGNRGSRFSNRPCGRFQPPVIFFSTRARGSGAIRETNRAERGDLASPARLPPGLPALQFSAITEWTEVRSSKRSMPFTTVVTKVPLMFPLNPADS